MKSIALGGLIAAALILALFVGCSLAVDKTVLPTRPKPETSTTAPTPTASTAPITSLPASQLG